MSANYQTEEADRIPRSTFDREHRAPDHGHDRYRAGTRTQHPRTRLYIA